MRFKYFSFMNSHISIKELSDIPEAKPMLDSLYQFTLNIIDLITENLLCSPTTSIEVYPTEEDQNVFAIRVLMVFVTNINLAKYNQVKKKLSSFCKNNDFPDVIIRYKEYGDNFYVHLDAIQYVKR